jgi:hypothetical protein
MILKETVRMTSGLLAIDIHSDPLMWSLHNLWTTLTCVRDKNVILAALTEMINRNVHSRAGPEVPLDTTFPWLKEVIQVVLTREDHRTAIVCFSCIIIKEVGLVDIITELLDDMIPSWAKKAA